MLLSETNSDVRQIVGPEKGRFDFEKYWIVLTTKTIQGSSLPFQGIDYIHSGHGLPLSMLGVSYSIADNVFQEDF